MRMQPSWHANEILESISNDQQGELKQRLAHAARDCRATADLPSFAQELYSELEACVETLGSASSSLDRCGAALQLLRHLAESGEQSRHYEPSGSRKLSISNNRLFPSLTI